jgi:hypothetical protein
MTNHIHIIALPKTETGLQSIFKLLHMRYAQRFNRQRGWKGYVWQGRYLSSALDEHDLWAAIRYVERNPVRAKFCRKLIFILGTATLTIVQSWQTIIGPLRLSKINSLNPLVIGRFGWHKETWKTSYRSFGEILIKDYPVALINFLNN